MNWSCKSFADLTPAELYDILALRATVFVVEQNCPYLDPDGKDKKAFHLMGYEDDVLIAYVRLLPNHVSYPEISIGRVVNAPTVRNQGVGKLLMTEAIRKCYDLFGKQPIRIGAQSYLLQFYGSLGFVPIGPEYLEDGIPHTEMILPI